MMKLKNEFIMPPVKTGFCSRNGIVTEKFINFYKRRAEYLGAITIEPLNIKRNARELPTQVGIDADDKIPGLKKLTDELHKSNTKVIAHLNHPGRMANPMIPGNRHISSSDQPCENGGAIPKQMDDDDLIMVKNLFSDAASRAVRAGFDIIELQFGHGYLLAQFLSPYINERQDDYGGSYENRMRFPLEVLEAVKNSADIPVIARISADEMIPNGIKINEMLEFAKILESNGIKAIHVSAGTICSSPPWFFQHMFIPKGKTWEFGSKIQNEINIPVIYVGKINSFEDIDKLKKEFNAKYIAIGRALIADPDFAAKYKWIKNGMPRPCMACSEGCLGGVKSGKGLSCVVNPAVGNDMDSISESDLKKDVAIIGGGLAGMEAALTLNKRGHNVDLYEKEELGGQFNLAYLPPNKDTLKRIIEYYRSELQTRKINIIKKEAEPGDITREKYDAVVLATGAVPAIPPIEGLKKYYWAEVLREHNLPESKRFLIIGGGMIGIETANMLLQKNNEVIIVEMLDDVARDMEMIERALTLKNFRGKNVKIYLNTKVTKVVNGTCFLEGKENARVENVDHIVVATGMKSYNPLGGKLPAEIEVHTIGDASKPGKAMSAIRDAYYTAKRI